MQSMMARFLRTRIAFLVAKRGGVNDIFGMARILFLQLILACSAIAAGHPAADLHDPCVPKCYKVGTFIVTINGLNWTSTSGDQGTLTAVLGGGYRWTSSVTGATGTLQGPFGSDLHYSWTNDDGSDAGKAVPVDC